MDNIINKCNNCEPAWLCEDCFQKNETMNEIDLKTKIEGLEKAIAEHKDFAGNYESALKKTKQELKDYNKVELTPMVFDDIYEAIEDAVNQYDFSDTENFDVEYGIDYDGRVTLESHELSDSSGLIDAISEKVYRLFKEAECPTEEENARDDKEAEELSDQINSTTTAEIVFDRNEELLDPMPPAIPVENEVTEEKPSKEDMKDFNNKIEETKENSFKKRTWFSK